MALAGVVLSIGLGARFGQARVSSQERATDAAFEAASVRPSGPGSPPMSVSTTPGRFTATNIDVRNLITVAYRLPWFRIIDAPAWSERYDVVAVMPPGSDASQLGAMLQDLLEERFMMRAHMEAREQPVYALVMARRDGRLGPALQRATVDCEAAMAGQGTPTGAPSPASAVQRCDEQIRAIGHVAIRGMSLDVLANYLSGSVQDRVVVNRTGLEGNFDLDLRFAPLSDGAARNSGDSPSLFTAIQEQLGLQLDARREPVEVLVVDSIARPSAN